MRVLILSQYYPPEIGAAQTRLATVSRHLRERGHHPEVLTALPNYPWGKILPGYRGRVLTRERWDGIPVRRVWVRASKRVDSKRLLCYASFVGMSLVGAIGLRRPDVILVESPPPTAMLSGWLLGTLWRAKTVMYVADVWPDAAVDAGMMREGSRSLSLARFLERWAYRRADVVTLSARGAIERLVNEKGVDRSKVAFLPNGTAVPNLPDRACARKELGVPDDQILVLYAGTLSYFHGVGVAVRAMDLLRDDPRLRLLILGEGSELGEVRRLASELDVANVDFLPPVDAQRLDTYWAAADIGLSCQRDLRITEIMRLAKVVATMGAGRPVVLSGRGESARLVREAEAGLVAPPEDAAELAKALGDLARAPEERARLGANGRRYVEANLSWDSLLTDWLRQLEDRGVR